MRNIIFNEDKIRLDSAFYFGKGVFETILIKEKPVFLKEHINRLNRAIKKLNLGEEVDEIIISKFIKENKIRNAALKIVVSENNLLFQVREIKYKEEDYFYGFKVRFSEVLRNSTSRLVSFKTLNYTENIIELDISKSYGYNEAIFLNEKGFITEGCTTNIFIIKDNKIYTPKVECGLLPGIVRQWVIDNFNAMEKEMTKEELLNADEIFLTNSLVGIIKVSNLEDKDFKCNLINNIKKAYDDVVKKGVWINE